MYSDYSTSDSEDTVRVDAGVASSSATPTSHLFLIPQRLNSGRASLSSSVSSTPLPSRPVSPLPHYYDHRLHLHSASCPASDDDSDTAHSPLIRQAASSSSRYPWIRESRRSANWWSTTPRRRRGRGSPLSRTLRRWVRRLVRHPFVPAQPITLVGLCFTHC